MSAITAVGSCQTFINIPTICFVRSGSDISLLFRDAPLYSALRLKTTLILLSLLPL